MRKDGQRFNNSETFSLACTDLFYLGAPSLVFFAGAGRELICTLTLANHGCCSCAGHPLPPPLHAPFTESCHNQMPKQNKDTNFFFLLRVYGVKFSFLAFVVKLFFKLKVRARAL